MSRRLSLLLAVLAACHDGPSEHAPDAERPTAGRSESAAKPTAHAATPTAHALPPGTPPLPTTVPTPPLPSTAHRAQAMAAPPATRDTAKPARPEHTAFRLVDNRHAAHRHVGGDLVLDAADIGFARYLRFGVPVQRWQLGQDIDGERAAVADKLANLELPLTADQARAITFVTARVHGADKQQLTLKINGRKPGKSATVDLVDGWATVHIPVARGYFTAGENQLVLETAGRGDPVAFAWLRFGRSIDDRDPRGAASFDDKAGTIALDRNASLTWYVTIPDGAHFVGSVTGRCKIELRARASDDSVAGGVLTAEHARGDGRGVPPAGSAAEGQRGSIDLAAMAGRVVALSLTARDCPRATLDAPHIALHGPGATPLAAAPPPRFIILWVMDALRADRIPIFTPGARAETPNFDELAKSSTVFRQYYVQGNESQTSHTSVWTGLYPAVHGVRLAGVGGAWRIADQFDVLAQQVAAAKYATLAVTGNGYVNDDGGYARGFQDFRNMMRETGVENGVILGEKIVDAALAKLDKHRDGPAYLFLGTIDTHSPWIARKPWIDRYSPGPYRGPFQEFGTAKDLGFKPGSMGCSIIPPPADIERLRAIYDSAISYHDVQVGRLIKQLQAWGIWDQTMLIITADHGEELFEDQRCGHGGSLRDTLVRVPLLIHDPARFPAGTIVDEGVEGVDVMPTVLTAIGAETPEGPQGAALEALAQGVGRGWPRPSYASQYEYAHAMRIGRWKIRVGNRGVPVVNDLVADPGEMRDLSATRAIERRMLTDNLGMFLALRARWRKAEWGVVTSVTASGALALDEATSP